MNDQSRVRRLQRHGRIDVGNRKDIMYWAGLWGLADQELRDAVAAVGPDPADVAAHLGQILD